MSHLWCTSGSSSNTLGWVGYILCLIYVVYSKLLFQVESGDASRSEITISENDDARGVFSFLSTQLAVPEPASSFLYVQRGAGLFGVVAVRYTVTLVTAGLSDLSSLNGQITFPNGASLVALPLSVADDLNPEFDETFTVTLTSPSGN